MLMPLRQPTLTRWLPQRCCSLLAALLIFLVAGLHLLFLRFGSLDLAPDEAHYWDWSRHLDWSYYSKGPLVAWLIRLSCELVGPWSAQTTGSLTFAVRLPAVLCGSLLLISLYVLTVQVFGRPRLGLAIVAGALTLPVIAVGSSLMTIDSPYTCCWGWALVFAHRAVTRNHLRAWLATGLVIGLGILAKYTMVLFPVSLSAFLLFSPAHRRLLVSTGFVSMAVIALACCFPILIWNAQHDWVTFLHVRRLAGLAPSAEPALRSGRFYPLGPLSFLAGQAALLLGYWFLVWLVAMLVCNPLRQHDPGVRFLWWLSVPVFLVFLGFSFKTGGGELNWPITAYLSGSILAAAWLVQQLQSPHPWYRRATITCVTATLFAGLGLTMLIHHSKIAHPLMERLAGPATPAQPYPVRRIDPTCRLRGWRYLASQIDQLRAQLRQQGNEPILAGVSWNLPGEVGVYCAGNPQAYSVGLMQGDRRSQYDLWLNPVDHPEQFLNRTFLIVGPIAPVVERAFVRVEPPIQVTYHEGGRPLAGWSLHICHGFKGFPNDKPLSPAH